MLGTGGCVAVLVVSLLILQFLKMQWASRKLPPGPIPFPILGTLWCFGFEWHQGSLSKFSKVYGKTFTIWIGHMPMVVLNGYHAVRDVLINHSKETSWRIVTPFVRDTMHGKGILFSSGHTWKQQRRFGMMTLRTLGMGKKGLEYRVQEEASYLVELFANTKGKPMDPSSFLFYSVSSVISRVVFGHNFSIQDEIFHKLIECIEYEGHFFLSSFHLLYELCPWLMRYLPGPHQKAFSCLEFIHSFSRKEIQNHKEKKKLDDSWDFIDFYLEEIEKNKGDPSSTFDEDNLLHVIYDLFTAGTDTIVSTLRWVFLCMVVHPDVQEKVQKEIDAVLTPSQCISYEDQKSMPYTSAVIYEILRFNFVLLAGTFRQCGSDTTLLGFPIKKGTIIIVDIASALNDPEQWETPQQFNPNHFLDKDGNFFIREAFIPFSAGPRLCLGEKLAKTELFLFITNVLRAFTLQLPEGMTEVNTRPVEGRFAVQAHPYVICAVPRKTIAA
ncbi:cytochrome P450 2J2-like [Hemicordylus capensis]|uniref:cytochrome P450 2J2-like n=1 Tax=Hemicordylus capensis TaxID=884348 RepID=UPI0023030BCF|nr:cytochrome P450 2J2-like [Hemicordylus capensis]